MNTCLSSNNAVCLEDLGHAWDWIHWMLLYQCCCLNPIEGNTFDWPQPKSNDGPRLGRQYLFSGHAEPRSRNPSGECCRRILIFGKSNNLKRSLVWTQLQNERRLGVPTGQHMLLSPATSQSTVVGRTFVGWFGQSYPLSVVKGNSPTKNSTKATSWAVGMYFRVND